MDKVCLTFEDTVRLLNWRDNHKELVRSVPQPLRAVKIITKHEGFHFECKVIRSGKVITMYPAYHNKKLGKVIFKLTDETDDFSGYYIVKNETSSVKHNDETLEVSPQNMMSVYCSLMAYMVYGKDEMVGSLVCDNTQTPLHEPRSKPSGKPKGYTYIFSNKYAKSGHAGHHASPRGIFGVRGHYRHYKNGNVVWIESYQKGTGKTKRKTYKMNKEECI